jgi:CBS domain-containing protein
MPLARDIMTKDVAFVRAETPIRDIAKLLADRRISAVPVLDDAGSPIGMVSEGDLLARKFASIQGERREWWLDLLAEGETLSPEFVASLQPENRAAADIMSTPVVAVEETTEIRAIARLLEEYRIKRVPVLRDGRVIGIVSRADLVRALALSEASESEAAATATHGLIGSFLAHLEPTPAPARSPTIAPTTPVNTSLSARRFRELGAEYRRRQRAERETAHRAVEAQIEHEIREMTNNHVDDAFWQTVLKGAAEAARHGEKEFLLLRFPNALCSDGGRAINVPLDDWPKTLRGEPAELYLRWQRDLQPRGFHLTARVLEFPGGLPGDIGLFLAWGG